MDITSQRGNPNLLKKIQKSAKEVSKQNGIANIQVPVQQKVEETGALASINKLNKGRTQLDSNISAMFSDNFLNNTPQKKILENTEHKKKKLIVEGSMEKRLEERLLDSIETLSDTKEYYNAISSLFTLYTIDKLTEGVIDTISIEDFKEIKSIIREFKSIIDRY